MTLSTIGWIGSILLAGCAIPEVYKAYKEKRTGLTWGFLILWLLGEIFTLIPILFKIQELFLIFNYSANLLLIGYIMKVKYDSGDY